MPGHISYDGNAKELEFPDLTNESGIKCSENIFDSMGGGGVSIESEQ